MHIKLCRVDDSAEQEEIQCYPKSYAVNATVTRNKGCRSYPRRSHGCGGNSDSIADKVTTNAIQKVREYSDQGYRYAVCLDLSKYFDTLNHELLMNMLREDIHDKRLIDLVLLAKSQRASERLLETSTRYCALPEKTDKKLRQKTE